MILQLPARSTLTKAQRRVLTQLRDTEYPDSEIVCAGLECWIALERTSWVLVRDLLCMVAISDVSTDGGKGCRRYVINETGRAILADERNIQAVAAALRQGGAWTWEGHRLVPMPAPTQE